METRLTGDVMAALGRPFDAALVNWKPQATTKDGKRALAVAYVDVRAYHDRLNEVAGADWSDDYEVLEGGRVILCRLTVCGVTRADIGEADSGEQNTATSAIAQAFKRACVKFGLGAYLYRLPKTWAEYDSTKRAFTDQALAELGRVAGGRNGQRPNGNGAPHYRDGQAVGDNAAELASYREYQEVHQGRAPGSLADLRSWAKAQRAN